jgi:hypothetical protein
MKHLAKHKNLLVSCAILAVLSVALLILPSLFGDHYVSQPLPARVSAAAEGKADLAQVATSTPVFVATHLPTPVPVKGIYMTSWVAGTPSLRTSLVRLLDTTEANTVVIDIKDYSGKIVFPVTDPGLKAYGSEEVRVRDLPQFIDTLHKKGVYVIGRVAVFQDKYFVTHRPDLAVKNKAGTAVWKDHKGISWIDAGSKEYWQYIVLLARESYKLGFDEINFDYIRFPSDGNMKDISFPQEPAGVTKPEMLKSFFSYLHDNLATSSPDTRMKISADLFGMVTTAKDDMGIGQILENAFPYFDYISPMVYPSHYPPTFQGFKEPEAHPYDVVHFAMQSAVDRAKQASTTPDKLRPWLQDFGLRMNYGPAEVRAQIKATTDVGLDSWLLWSASNKYTQGALEPR